MNQFLNSLLSNRLAPRSDLQLARRLWHMIMGLVIAAVYQSGFNRGSAIILVGSLLVFDLIIEVTRLRSPGVNKRVLEIMGPIMRSCEVKQLSGVAYYLSAVILVIAIFPKPIAVLGILYLAVGDPIASVVGILYGDRAGRLPNGKSLLGTGASVLACFAATVAFLGGMGLPATMVLLLATIGGVSGGVAELLPLEVDDNFSIPIVSGFALWLAVIVTGVTLI